MLIVKFFNTMTQILRNCFYRTQTLDYVSASSLKQLLCLVVSKNIYIFANVMTVIITYITIVYEIL